MAGLSANPQADCGARKCVTPMEFSASLIGSQGRYQPDVEPH